MEEKYYHNPDTDELIKLVVRDDGIEVTPMACLYTFETEEEEQEEENV